MRVVGLRERPVFSLYLLLDDPASRTFTEDSVKIAGPRPGAVRAASIGPSTYVHRRRRGQTRIA
jgi:hypothetical protein